MWLLACLFCLLGGFYLQVKGQTCSCDGTGGCDFTKTCVPAGKCTKHNVALGKTATMSSTFNRISINETSGPACLAVNGNAGTAFRPINQFPNSPNCVHTGERDVNPFWAVDLGQEFSIIGITVYARDVQVRRMAYANLSVDNYTQIVFPPNNISVKTEIPFWPPVKGRRVRFAQNRVAPSDPYPFVNMCEMQVWACLDGFFGQNCHNKCGHCQNNYPCDVVTGNCTSGCDSGWQGLRCDQICPPGTYGKNCAFQCGQCLNDIPCNHVDGTCTLDCVCGYHGDLSRRAHSSDPLAGLVASAIAGSFVIVAVIVVVIHLFFEESTGLQKMTRKPKHLWKIPA